MFWMVAVEEQLVTTVHLTQCKRLASSLSITFSELCAKEVGAFSLGKVCFSAVIQSDIIVNKLLHPYGCHSHFQ